MFSKKDFILLDEQIGISKIIMYKEENYEKKNKNYSNKFYARIKFSSDVLFC